MEPCSLSPFIVLLLVPFQFPESDSLYHIGFFYYLNLYLFTLWLIFSYKLGATLYLFMLKFGVLGQITNPFGSQFYCCKKRRFKKITSRTLASFKILCFLSMNWSVASLVIIKYHQGQIIPREICFSDLIIKKLDMLCHFMLNGTIYSQMRGRGPYQ